jgi:hypothetical protein
MDHFARSRYAQLPVVGSGDSKVIGFVSRREFVAAYDARLAPIQSRQA